MPDNSSHSTDGIIDSSLLSQKIPNADTHEHQQFKNTIGSSRDFSGESSIARSEGTEVVDTDQSLKVTKNSPLKILPNFSKMVTSNASQTSKDIRLPMSRFAMITEEERENLCGGRSWAELIDIKNVEYQLFYESDGRVSFASLKALNEGDILTYTIKISRTSQKRPPNTFELSPIEYYSALPQNHKFQGGSQIKPLAVCSSSLTAEEKLDNWHLTQKYGKNHPGIKGIKENQSHGSVATEVKSGSYYCTGCGDHIRAGNRFSCQKSRDNRKITSNKIDTSEDRPVSKKRKT